MSRKGVGLAAFDGRARLTPAQYASHGSTLRSADASALEAQLAVFRSLLHQFAATHAKDIRGNPTFRAQFARMCAAIGVDPLASSSSSSSGSGGNGGGGRGVGSIWAQLLGRTVNDFYFGLAVRVVEVCSETRGENGGLIELSKVRERIMRARVEGGAEVTELSHPPVLAFFGFRSVKVPRVLEGYLKVDHSSYIYPISIPRVLVLYVCFLFNIFTSLLYFYIFSSFFLLFKLISILFHFIGI